MINSKEIVLFDNLAQIEFENQYYDFHNDYNCTKILFEKDVLLILFKGINNSIQMSLKYIDVKIEKFDFFNSLREEYFTIDNIFRGRYEKNGTLIEFKDNNKGYFYLECYEGQKIEFWSSGLVIEDYGIVENVGNGSN